MLTQPLTNDQARAQAVNNRLTATVSCELIHLVDHAPMESGFGFADCLVHLVLGGEGEDAYHDVELIDYRVVGHTGQQTLFIEVTLDVKLFLRLINVSGWDAQNHVRWQKWIEDYTAEIGAGSQEEADFLAQLNPTLVGFYTHPATANTREIGELWGACQHFKDRHERAARIAADAAWKLAHPNEPF